MCDKIGAELCPAKFQSIAEHMQGPLGSSAGNETRRATTLVAADKFKCPFGEFIFSPA